MCALRYGVPNKGLNPLRRESGYPFMAKGVTMKSRLLPMLLSYEHPAYRGGSALFYWNQKHLIGFGLILQGIGTADGIHRRAVFFGQLPEAFSPGPAQNQRRAVRTGLPDFSKLQIRHHGNAL